ncbi:MAG: DNA2/NAM7 family helicase [Thermoflexales bacterium]|nr:DNA2/NAM7 family helicase [Thermoflexales bacterium]
MTGTAQQAQFLLRLRRFVLAERDAQRRQVESEWVKPLAERVADGLAIEGVRFVRLTPQGLLELACDRNHSRFREGDVLCLNRGSPFFEPTVKVTLEVDDETRLLVLCDDPKDLDIVLHQPEGWVLDQGYLDLSHYVLDALKEAGDTLVGIRYILPLLMGEARPQMDMARYERALERAAELGLNDDQSEAFAQAYATDLTWLIQGPPGTGKTRVLAHLAEMLVRDGERVLITAFTHRAINNALNTLAKVAPDVPAAKIGLPHRADDLRGVENYPYFNLSPMAEMDNGYVIGATPFATRNKRLSGVEFDTVIFDEASQITLPLAVMGMLAGKRFIFFGDQKQLPPVLTRRYSGGAFRESVFEVLAGQGLETMLTETYRLNRELLEWPSAAFYAGKLRPASEAVARHRLELDALSRFAEVLDPAHPKVFLDLQHRNATTRNHKEASVVVDLLLALLEGGLPPWEVGVVTPYRAQGREIRALLRAALPDAEMRGHIVVDTVERMQGQEREAVIVSLTTSNPTFAAHLAEFFFQPERFNVAVTRPRSKLIIVGSRHVLNAQPEDPEQQAAVKLFRDLIHSCAYRTLDYL